MQALTAQATPGGTRGAERDRLLRALSNIYGNMKHVRLVLDDTLQETIFKWWNAGCPDRAVGRYIWSCFDRLDFLGDPAFSKTDRTGRRTRSRKDVFERVWLEQHNDPEVVRVLLHAAHRAFQDRKTYESLARRSEDAPPMLLSLERAFLMNELERRACRRDAGV